jgi:hypothetical protein
MTTRSIIASAAAMLVAGALLSTAAVARSVASSDEATKITSTTKADQGMTQLAQDTKKGKRKAKKKSN